MPKKTKRPYSQIFLDTLRLKSNGEQKLIGNIALRSELGWSEETYSRVKNQLREENAIIVGTGKGGSVALANSYGNSPINVFISYSHADEELKNELLKHLEPLRRLNLISSWHDRKLMPGGKWDKSISKNMDESKIILLLISIDFINSDYCYDVELDRALDLHQQNSAFVVPVILRTCLWQHTSFAELQALPKDAKAVSTWPDKDEAFTHIANGIRELAEKIRDTL